MLRLLVTDLSNGGSTKIILEGDMNARVENWAIYDFQISVLIVYFDVGIN